jgi:DNA replication and repair protein RecF
MYIRDLHLTHFRNYEQQKVNLLSGVNVFVGENAQGKTNALESIYMLALGKSHRTSKDADCIQWGADGAAIHATVIVKDRERNLSLELKPGNKKAQVNGVSQVKMTDFVGHFQVVLFAPEDLQLVKGNPGVRRRFMDMELGQTQPKYLYHLSQYQRTLQQRNALLKNGNVDSTFLEVFDSQLVEHGAQVLHRRFRFLERMRSLSQGIYESIADGREHLEIQYACSIPGLKADMSAFTLTDIEEMLGKALAAKRSADQFAGHTTVGPHRDDLMFFLNGQSVHAYASQGQQRTIALSLRLAEIDFIYQEIGEYPVLLLDDVLSELDDLRQKNLVLSMSEKVQTIITTASLFQLHDKLRNDARLFQVCSGIIQNEG